LLTRRRARKLPELYSLRVSYNVCIMMAPAPAPVVFSAPAPAPVLSKAEHFCGGLVQRCRGGSFKDIKWDEACLRAAVDAFRVPERRCYVPEGCDPYAHNCPTIGANEQSTVAMSRPVTHLFCLHALATLMRDGTPTDGRFRVLDVGSGSGFLTVALAALLDQECVAGDVLGIDVEETLVRLGRENFAKDALALPVKFRREDAWASPKRRGEFLFICVGACAEHVPMALADRLAPGGLLVVPIVATGTRRQAYLMVRRDLRGRLREPERICEASYVPLIDTRVWTRRLFRELHAIDATRRFLAGLRAREAKVGDGRLLRRRGRSAHLYARRSRRREFEIYEARRGRRERCRRILGAQRHVRARELPGAVGAVRGAGGMNK